MNSTMISIKSAGLLIKGILGEKADRKVVLKILVASIIPFIFRNQLLEFVVNANATQTKVIISGLIALMIFLILTLTAFVNKTYTFWIKIQPDSESKRFCSYFPKISPKEFTLVVMAMFMFSLKLAYSYDVILGLKFLFGMFLAFVIVMKVIGRWSDKDINNWEDTTNKRTILLMLVKGLCKRLNHQEIDEIREFVKEKEFGKMKDLNKELMCKCKTKEYGAEFSESKTTVKDFLRTLNYNESTKDSIEEFLNSLTSEYKLVPKEIQEQHDVESFVIYVRLK